MNKIYYVSLDSKYYNKAHGWVDHKRFANKLTYNETQALKQFYPNLKIAM